MDLLSKIKVIHERKDEEMIKPCTLIYPISVGLIYQNYTICKTFKSLQVDIKV